MAASSTTTTTISCRLGPPAPPKQAPAAAGARSRRRQAPAGVSVSWASHALRRASVAAAACAVIGMASGGDMALALARDYGAVVAAARTDAVAVGAARAKAPPPRRWSDRRQCPAWRANSLENIVPENLPRPSAPRRFDSVSVSAADGAAAAPDFLVAPRPGTGCFSL